MQHVFCASAAGIMASWLLLAGCTGGNSTTGTGGSSTGSTSASGVGGASAAAVQAYCDATADAYCEAYFACCPKAVMRYGGPVEKCKQLYRYGGAGCLYGVGERYAASIDAGHTVFSQANLDVCVAHLKSMTAGGAACVEAIDDYFRLVCITTVFQGQLAPGEPCANLLGFSTSTVECKHGTCDLATSICKPLAQLGEPCNSSILGSYPDCEDGARILCAVQFDQDAGQFDYDAGLHCVHRGDIGEPCWQDAECKSFNCEKTSGTCVLPTQEGTCY